MNPDKMTLKNNNDNNSPKIIVKITKKKINDVRLKMVNEWIVNLHMY